MMARPGRRRVRHWVLEAFDRMQRSGTPKHRWTVTLVCLGILLFTAGTASMNRVKYLSLKSTWSFDLGFFNNSAFNLAHGRSITYIQPRSWFSSEDSNHEGPSVFRSNHFSPMRLLLSGTIYRAAPDILTLMIVQSAIIGLGALPLYLFVLHRTKAASLALLGAATYLLHPVILHLAFNDFRVLAFGISLALLALWLHATGRMAAFALCSLLMLACRPEYVFLLLIFPLVNWRFRPPAASRRGWLLVPLALALGWAILTNGYYQVAFGQPWPLLTPRAAGHGVEILRDLFWRRVPIFARLAFPPALVGLAAPEVLIMSLPFVAGADSVRPPAFPHHDLQHLSPAMVLVFWAFAVGLIRLWPFLSRVPGRAVRAQLALAVAVLAVFGHFALGAAHEYLVEDPARHEWVTSANDALPPDATVLVPIGLTARFSGHTRVLAMDWLPVARRSELSAAQTASIVSGLVSVCDLIVTDERNAWMIPLIESSGRFGPGRIREGFHLFRADVGQSAIADPDRRLQRILGWRRMTARELIWSGITPM